MFYCNVACLKLSSSWETSINAVYVLASKVLCKSIYYLLPYYHFWKSEFCINPLLSGFTTIRIWSIPCTALSFLLWYQKEEFKAFVSSQLGLKMLNILKYNSEIHLASFEENILPSPAMEKECSQMRYY